MSSSTTKYHYIYLLQEREFLNTDIFKVGRTCQVDFRRFNSYPKDSKLVSYVTVKDSIKMEKIILDDFKRQFKLRSDVGREYFQGDSMLMIKNIMKVVEEEEKEEIDSKEKEKEVKSKEDSKDVQTQKKVTKFQCKMCYKCFTRNEKLKYHESKCDGSNPLQCQICMKLFKNKHGKSQHKYYVKCKPVLVSHESAVNDFNQNTKSNNNKDREIINLKNEIINLKNLLKIKDKDIEIIDLKHIIHINEKDKEIEIINLKNEIKDLNHIIHINETNKYKELEIIDLKNVIHINEKDKVLELEIIDLKNVIHINEKDKVLELEIIDLKNVINEKDKYKELEIIDLKNVINENNRELELEIIDLKNVIHMNENNRELELEIIDLKNVIHMNKKDKKLELEIKDLNHVIIDKDFEITELKLINNSIKVVIKELQELQKI
jgi:hypothetical protein